MKHSVKRFIQKYRGQILTKDGQILTKDELVTDDDLFAHLTGQATRGIFTLYERNEAKAAKANPARAVQVAQAINLKKAADTRQKLSGRSRFTKALVGLIGGRRVHPAELT